MEDFLDDVCISLGVCVSVLRFLATSHEVVRRRYTSPPDNVSLLAKFYPIFWYARPPYGQNWRI